MSFQCPVVVRPALLGPLLAKIARFGRGTRYAGGQNDANLGTVLADGLGQLEARAVVSLDIEEGQVELHLKTKSLRRFLMRTSLNDFVAALPQIGGKRRSHEDVPVNEQQSRRFRRS